MALAQKPMIVTGSSFAAAVIPVPSTYMKIVGPDTEGLESSPHGDRNGNIWDGNIEIKVLDLDASAVALPVAYPVSLRLVPLVTSPQVCESISKIDGSAQLFAHDRIEFEPAAAFHIGGCPVPLPPASR